MITLFLIGALGLGRLVVNALHLAWNRIEGWALVLLFGYFFGAWTLLLACAVFGFGIGGIITVALLMLAWIAPAARRPLSLVSFAAGRQTVAWLLSTGTISYILGYLLFRQMLEPGPGGEYSDAVSGFGTDLPLHLSMITSFAYAPHFTWHFSLMPWAYLTYPFLINFLTGIFVRWGAGLRLSLLLTSIPLNLILVQLMFFLGYRALKSARAAAFFTVIVLLAGNSFGFIPFLVGTLSFTPGLAHFLTSLPADITGTAFYSYGDFIGSLVPQRSFQFGLPVLCSALILICRLSEEMGIRQRRRLLLLLGAIVGFLPLAHTHSFFVGMATLIVFALLDRKAAGVREWLLSIVTGLAIALPQIVYQLFSNHHAHFVRFSPGWTYTEGDFPHIRHSAGMLCFVLANFGLILALTALSYRCLKDLDIARRLILLGGVLFVLCFLFDFQPSPYDNLKFLFYAFLFFGLGTAYYLSLLSRARKWQWIPLMLMLVGSGILGTISISQQHRVLYTDAALREARELRRRLPGEALVLTSDTIEQPLWGLAGQPVVEGFHYWLWSYGLPVDRITRDVTEMYSGGGDALALLRKYRVQYVLISHYERKSYRYLNEPFFSAHFPLVYQHDGMEIYQIRRES